MKIYTRIRINMATGHIVNEQGYEYHGPVTRLKGPEPPPPPPPDPRIKEEKRLEEERRERIKRGTIGRRSTILTGGAGLTEPANIQRKTLLGE